MAQHHTSKNTSINSNKLPKVYGIMKRHGLLNKSVRVFDYGCGKFPELIAEKIGDHVADYIPFDPYNHFNKESLVKVTRKPADIGIMSNVINVIDNDIAVIEAIKIAKLYCNTLYITVYEGDKSGIGKESMDDCWQANRTIKDWFTLLVNHFDCYRRYGMIIVR